MHVVEVAGRSGSGRGRRCRRSPPRPGCGRGSGRWRRRRSSPAANARSRRPRWRHSCLVAAALDAHGDELGGAFAVAHDRLRKLRRHRDHRVAQRAALGRLRASRCAAWPARCVAISMNESLVDVSPSTVMRLKLARPLRAPAPAAAAGAIAASVATKPSIVAMFGPDHAGALGDAGDGDRRGRRSCTWRDAALGSVSVVMMPSAASSQSSALQVGDAPPAGRLRCDRPAAAP